jgi:hypothetical protein
MADGIGFEPMGLSSSGVQGHRTRPDYANHPWRKTEDSNPYNLRWTAFEAVAIPLRQSSNADAITLDINHDASISFGYELSTG